MNPEMIELAKRAVACKGWWWMPGMLAWRPDCPPVRLTAIEDAGNALQENGWLPNLNDPATLGCLLALVREAWRADWIYVVCDQMNDPEDGGYLWRVCVPWQSDIVAPSEAEALVVALESK